MKTSATDIVREAIESGIRDGAISPTSPLDFADECASALTQTYLPRDMARLMEAMCDKRTTEQVVLPSKHGLPTLTNIVYNDEKTEAHLVFCVWSHRLGEWRIVASSFCPERRWSAMTREDPSMLVKAEFRTYLDVF